MIDFEEVKKQQLEYRRATRTKQIPLDLDRLFAVAEERRNATKLVVRWSPSILDFERKRGLASIAQSQRMQCLESLWIAPAKTLVNVEFYSF